VTIGAQPRRNGVRARQRETGAAVVEGAIGPRHRVVAVHAGGREPRVGHRTGRVVVIGLMAADASGRQRGVVVIGMAIGARPRRHHVRSGQRERRVVVIEGRIRPERCVVTKLAGRREAGVRHRTGRIVEVGLVTRNAERTLQGVVIGNVAVGAGSRRHHMRARQREARGRVIELRVGPLHGVMTLLARGREAGVRDGSGRVVEVGLVARNARGHGDVVVVAAVAIGARPRRHGVRSGQGKRRLGVVKGGRLPGRSRVAQLAGLRESSGHMVRIRRTLEVRQVAGNARRTGDVVVAKFCVVAIRALPRRNGVRARQGESRNVVIEGRVAPGDRVVAGFALGGESLVRYGGGRIVVVVLMARNAKRAGQVVVVVDVAVGALPWRHRVCPGQREPRSAVIELRIQPVVSRVAGFAGRRKLAGDVVGISAPREIRGVAGIALRGHRLKLAVRHTLVAGIAVHGRVRSGQREPVVMLLDLLNGNLPAPDRVALLAIRSQLPLVNVSVAVLASLPHVGEYRPDVTLHAGHGLVHTTERVTRLIMVEFGNCADRFPSARRVTVLTGHAQVAVRTVRACGGLPVRGSGNSRNRQHQRCDQIECAPRPEHALAPCFGPLLRWIRMRRFRRVKQFPVQLE